MLKTIGLRVHDCRQCGKQFEGTVNYRYKLPDRERKARSIYFCSYSCLQKYRQENNLRERGYTS